MNKFIRKAPDEYLVRNRLYCFSVFLMCFIVILILHALILSLSTLCRRFCNAIFYQKQKNYANFSFTKIFSYLNVAFKSSSQTMYLKSQTFQTFQTFQHQVERLKLCWFMQSKLLVFSQGEYKLLLQRKN